jgi:hypothetical protein
VAVTPATSFISDTGVLCADCFQRWEQQQQITQNTATMKDVGRLVHASRLATLHGLNWGVAVILFAGWVNVPTWLSSVLIAAVLVIAFAMGFRSRIAFQVALALDTGGALVLLVASVSQLSGGRLLILLFPILFGGWLGFLTWRARDVFAAGPRL